MGCADGMVGRKGIIQSEMADFDACPERESTESGAVGRAQLLAAHVVIPCPEVETFRNQELGSKDEVPEEIVEERKIVFDGFATQVKFNGGIGIVKDEPWPVDIVNGDGKTQGHVGQALRNPQQYQPTKAHLLRSQCPR